MSRARFTRGQRLVLVVMAVATVGMFGLLAYSIITTVRQPVPSPPLRLTPLVTSPLATPLPPTATSTPTPTATPTPTPTATRPVPLSQLQSARAVREVGRIVAEVRDLPPVEQIPVSFPPEHEVAIFLLQQYQEEQPQEVLALYSALGLIPPLDPLPLPDVAVQAAHISSLYLPAGRQIMLVAGGGPATLEDEQALAYTLAHALLDQQFNVESLVPCRETTDALLAMRALVEGDAVLTTAGYMGVEADPEEFSQLAQVVAAALEPSYAPLTDNPIFEQLRLFPYRDGGQLATALFDEGGWDAVNRAYARLPCSTEQVLHPERYLDGQSVQGVVLPDLTASLEGDWELVRQDTLGELILGLHLAAYVEDEEVAWDAADGWAGDTFTLWENGEGEQVILWRIVWDDRDEAEAFEQAYTLLIPRFRVPPLIASELPAGMPGRLWEGPAGAAYLGRAGRVVAVVWGPDAEVVTAVAEALP